MVISSQKLKTLTRFLNKSAKIVKNSSRPTGTNKQEQREAGTRRHNGGPVPAFFSPPITVGRRANSKGHRHITSATPRPTGTPQEQHKQTGTKGGRDPAPQWRTRTGFLFASPSTNNKGHCRSQQRNIQGRLAQTSQIDGPMGGESAAAGTKTTCAPWG